MSSVAGYLGVFLFIVSLVAISYHPPERKVAVANVSQLSATQAASSTASNGDVDQLLATNIGANLADSTDLPIANNVANLSQSLKVESALAKTESDTISKPQIVQPTADNRTTRQYTTVAGDTVPAIAQKYGVSTQTVRWANNLTSDAVEPAKTLNIPAKDGILYTVKSGDTIDSIVTKYKADKNVVIHDNDLERSEPSVGQQLILASGELPESERPGYVAPRVYTPTTNNTTNYSLGAGSGATANNLAVSAGNRYSWGYCTWYSYERRVQLGRPIGSFWGNASTWAYNARLAGFRVDNSPEPGAVMANGGGYGHVAVVESVNPGVSVRISEMNAYRWGGGFNRISGGDIAWGEAVSGMYQYIH